ncbi:MAG: heavy metal-responsive transcriptional regulator [Planctomycetota bacterium]|nr:MAG: heavy metal-responsive transcriptional regulator [Planctomycetota bacterium]
MDHHYTIGRLARAAGVPVSTVRYYERRGLVKPDARSDGNYRLYGEDSLRRLRFVRSAQAAGFTLLDIALLLRFRDGDVSPCAKVQRLISDRLESVSRQIEQLQQVDRMLRNWLKVCRRSERTGRCGVLDGLAADDA